MLRVRGRWLPAVAAGAVLLFVLGLQVGAAAAVEEAAADPVLIAVVNRSRFDAVSF